VVAKHVHKTLQELYSPPPTSASTAEAASEDTSKPSSENIAASDTNNNNSVQVYLPGRAAFRLCRGKSTESHVIQSLVDHHLARFDEAVINAASLKSKSELLEIFLSRFGWVYCRVYQGGKGGES
jgi:hypothetical protein